jgi:hypothetical protein
MAVDCQRIADLMPYINMIWSSPLQIGVSIIMLYQILGPSVFAGKSNDAVFHQYTVTVRHRNINCSPSVSVADPGCLSRILIFVHPSSQISVAGSRIQKQQQKRGGKNFYYLFCCHKYHKIVNY